MSEHDKRLRRIQEVLGAPDARFLKEKGIHPLDKRPRRDRRRINKQGKVHFKSLQKAWRNMLLSGAGYSVDQLLRQFAHEYTDRCNAHGSQVMPASFNIMEAYLEPTKVDRLPLFKVRKEKDHIYSLVDYLDWVTSQDAPNDFTGNAYNLTEGVIYNYTPLGSHGDLSISYKESRCFVFNGFSIIRYGSEITWLLLGGPKLTKEEIDELNSNSQAILIDDDNDIDPRKKYLLERFKDTKKGRALFLDGYDDVHKTVICGRFDLDTKKHDVRYRFSEFENMWDVRTDDPTIFDAQDADDLDDNLLRYLVSAEEEFKQDSVIWHLAEALFALPAYFDFKLHLVVNKKKEIGLDSKKGNNTKNTYKNNSQRKKYKTITSLEIIDINSQLVKAYTPPRYKVEVNGFWRKLNDSNSCGQDKKGNPVKGMTWVRGHMRWRDKPDPPHKTIYLKSTVQAARKKAAAISNSIDSSSINEIYEFVEPSEQTTNKDGYLYIMRCPLMEDDVFKIGYTHKTPEDRAKELSDSSGIPLSFIVVESWYCLNPRDIEKQVHLVLSPFRINPRREFFKGSYEHLREKISPILNKQ